MSTSRMQRRRRIGYWSTATLFRLLLAIMPFSCSHASPGGNGVAYAAAAPPCLDATVETLYVQGRYAEAESAARGALDACSQSTGARSAETAAAHLQLSKILRALGKYADAAAQAHAALDICETGSAPNGPETASARLELARADLALGRYSHGLPLARSALEARERSTSKASQETAEALTVVADLDGSLGDYPAGLEMARRALKIRETAANPQNPDTAETLNVLGLIHMGMGNYTDALPLHQRALDIRRRALGPEHPVTAESESNLGAAYWAQRQYDRAAELMQHALAIKERTLPADHPQTALALNNLAELYRRTGKAAQAVSFWERALDIYQRRLGSDHPYTADVRSNLASYYWTVGNLSKALALQKDAAGGLERSLGPDHPHTARALNLLAGMYQSNGDDAQALAAYRRGLAADDRNLATVFSVTSEEEKLRYLLKTEGHYLAALSLIRRRFSTDADGARFGLELVLRRKGVVLDAQARSQEMLAGQLRGEAAQTWQRLARQRSALAKLLLGGPGGRAPDEYAGAVRDLQEQIAQEERFLSERSGIVAEEVAQRDATVERVAAKLPPGSVLAEFVLVPDWDPKLVRWAGTSRYLAFVLTSNGQVRLVDLGASDAIDATVRDTLDAINDKAMLSRSRNDYVQRSDAQLAKLYKTLLAPVDRAAGPHAEIIVSPDGQLYQVPVGALQVRDGSYLIEDRTVSYVTSGRDLLRDQVEKASGADLLLVGNPAYGDPAVVGAKTGKQPALRAATYRGLSFDQLDGVAREAQEIPTLVNGTHIELLGPKATERALREAKAPRILHFATHGFFLPENETLPADPLGRQAGGSAAQVAGVDSPMVRSGLAMAGANYAETVTTGDDGILTALEVTGLNLHGTELVVLSACQTALGEVRVGGGVYGLRRAFVLAGARNIVMTLWNVRDRVAYNQMHRFYEEYQRGATPAQALRAAQLETLREERDAQGGKPNVPARIWAPFIVQRTGS